MKCRIRPAAFLVILIALFTAPVGNAAVFNITDGDVVGLINAINTANGNLENDTINLAASGAYVLDSQPGIPFMQDGNNGLPPIQADSGNTITINGNDATIERSTSAPIDFRFFYIYTDAEITLDHLTLKNGNPGSSDNGGAIYANGNLTLSHVSLLDNSALDGGAVYIDSQGTPVSATISDSLISNNTAQGEGGGIKSIAVVTFGDIAVNITDSTIDSNTADGGNGGGLNIYSDIGTTQFDIVDSTISNNTCNGVGGGFCALSSATVNLTNSTVGGNSANEGGGGLFYDEFSSGDLKNVTITANTADANDSNDTSSFPEKGGGLFVAGTLILESTLIAGNTHNSSWITPPLSPDVFTDVAASLGSGGYNLIGSVGETDFFSNTTGDRYGDPFNTTTPNAGALEQSTPIDPLLDALADNGGPTKTYALSSGSPAIDHGSNPGALDYDQRGDPFVRSFDGDGSSTDEPDIGAYEYQPPPPGCPSGDHLFVDKTATGANDGTSWADAFTDLESALTLADSGTCTGVTAIWTAGGTYTPSVPSGRTATFALPDGISLYGGFTGGETDLFQRNWQSNPPSILSGDLAGNDSATGDISENAYNVVTASSVSGVHLDGFIITGGNADGTSFPYNSGAGINITDSTVELRHCKIHNNHAVETGGGVYSDSTSDTKYVFVKIQENSAAWGGGVRTGATGAVFTHCEIRGNESVSGGGGLRSEATAIQLLNSLVSGNFSQGSAGGLEHFGGTLTVRNCTIAGNAPRGLDTLSPTNIYNSIFWDNDPYQIEDTMNYAVVNDSIVQGGWTGAGANVSDENPNFVNSVVNTGSPNLLGNYHFLGCSPALDAGDDTEAPLDVADLDEDSDTIEAAPLDLDRISRLLDGDGDAAAVIDLGPYEKIPMATDMEVKVVTSGTYDPLPDDGTLDFGTTRAGLAVTRKVIIFNHGEDPLVVSNPSPLTGAFSLLDTIPDTIPAGGSEIYRFRFSPLAADAYSDVFSFESNDCAKNPYSFSLTGEAQPPLATIENASGTEGETLVFSVTLTGRNPNYPIEISYSTAPLTAESEVDYESTSGILTIPENGGSGSIEVPTMEDTEPEGEETFELQLSASSVELASDTAIGTIYDLPRNHRPRFVSNPVKEAFVGRQYQYGISVWDPDSGDSVSITAIGLPNWMQLVTDPSAFPDATATGVNESGSNNVSGTPVGNSTAGTVVAWLMGIPEEAHLGAHDVLLSATDTHGASRLQMFEIQVKVSDSIPTVVGHREFSTQMDTPVTMVINDFIVADPDSDFPEDFSLIISSGENYRISGNRIMPGRGYVGTLFVTIRVSDGEHESDPYVVEIPVHAVTGFRAITGRIYNLAADDEVFLHAWSASQEFSRVLRVAGSGVVSAGRLVRQNETDYVEYTITDLVPASDYRVEVDSTDYLYQVFNQKTDWESADLVSLLSDDAAGVDFHLIPGNEVISGVLIFPESAGVGDSAVVYVKSAETGSNGSTVVTYTGEAETPFAVTELLPAEDFRVAVRSDQYRDRFYDDTESGAVSLSEALFVKTGTEAARNIRIRLQPGARIFGSIRGIISGEVRVQARSKSAASGGKTRTKADGSFVLEGLEPAADYIVSASAQNMAPFYYAGDTTVRDPQKAVLIDVRQGDVTGVEMVFPAGGQIRGRVTDDARTPLAEIWVEAEALNLEDATVSVEGGNGKYTNEAGEYILSGLSTETDYTVRAIPEPGSGLGVSTKTGVPVGADDIDFVLTPKPLFRISGSIQNQSGDYIPSVAVEIRSDSAGTYAWDSTDVELPDGTEDLHVKNEYFIEGLPPADDYVLTARPPATSPYAVFHLKGLSIREDTVVNITLAPGAAVLGRTWLVGGENGAEPLSGVRVFARSRENGFTGTAESGADGRFVIPNAPQSAVLTLATRSEFVDAFVTDVQPESEADLYLGRGAAIEGTVVTDTSGGPVPSAAVSVVSDSMGRATGFSGSAETGAQGRYSIPGLRIADDSGRPVTDYRVVVVSDQYPAHTSPGHAAGDIVDFRLVKSEANQITGRVAGYDPNRFDVVVIDVFDETGVFLKSAFVNPNGEFTIPGLSPGIRYKFLFTGFFRGTATRRQAQTADDDFSQWAAPGTGVSEETAAAVYDTDSDLTFQFNEAAEGYEHPPEGIPGVVQNLRSPVEGMLTNLPDITVGWDPPQSNTRRTSSNRYYYAFNDNPDFAITKRTAPNRPPIDTHQVTSTGLAADDTPIFAHVAAVDLRGRIGPTNRLSFRLDTVPPKNVEVQLPPSTISRSVDLKLGATGARWMYLSNSDYAEGGDWEPWARDITWRLSEGAGTKSVFLRVQDEAGNTADGLSTTELVASQHTIQVTAGPGGAVSPAGQILVGDGADAEFLLLPDDGYVVDTVTIDGVPATPSGNRLIIPGVTSDRALSVTFRLAPATSHVIRVTGGPGGTLTPSGEITVREGESLTIQVAPDEGYRVDTVHLDGRPVRLTDMGDYRFINIDRSYELAVTFGPENG